MRIRLRAIVVVAVLGAGCGGSASSAAGTVLCSELTAVPGAAGCFAGRVAVVEFGDGWALGPGDVVLSKGALLGTTVGPATIQLTDGTALQVPPNTPGGNQCAELLRDEDWYAINGLPGPPDRGWQNAYGHCYLYGGLNADGSVAWFNAATYGESEPVEGAGDVFVAVVEPVVDVASGAVTVQGGVTFSTAADAPVEMCSAAIKTIALIDVRTSLVTATECVRSL